MAADVIAYVAVSLDGYIAHDDGTSDYLERFGTEEFDFHGFFSTIGAVVLGGRTYDRVAARWPYGDLPGLILTSRDLPVAEGATLQFSHAPTGEAIRAFAGTTDKRIWVVGGGEVITDAINDGAIDILEMYVMPIAIGSGIPLFPRSIEPVLELRVASAFANGVVRLVYHPTRG